MNKLILGILLGITISFIFHASKGETSNLPLPSISCFSPSPEPTATENLNNQL